MPVTEQVVKSAFELAFNAVLPNRPQPLRGRSWSAHGPIRHVDVSTDSGVSWRPARLHGPDFPRAWVRWEFPWIPARFGGPVEDQGHGPGRSADRRGERVRVGEGDR